MSDLLGRITAALADRYPIEREIGRGGMATVYLARDPRHHRSVAIKVLSQDVAAMLGPDRFLREIELAARLNHPHILPLYDSGEVDGMLFYVMPFIEGESLRARLDRDKQLPIDEAVQLIRKVATALDYAHRHGVVHRDIKPENILLHEGEPLVADFGIALAVSEAGADRLTGTGLTIGTPYYMSPEQATGDRQLDARSDIYSLGCVLFEMLAGETPHTGSSAQVVLARILTEPPRELRKLRASVSPYLESVVGKSLSRLPADRFLTASSFAEALARTEPSGTPSGPTQVHVSNPDVSPNAAPAAHHRLPLARWAPWLVAALAVAASVVFWFRPGLVIPPSSDAELSTEQFQQELARGEAVILDTRPHLEFSISHVPGALNVAARPGVPMSMYVSDIAEVGRLVGGNLARPLVLYCNGPFCPKSKRISAELEAAGYSNVRRYQLGMPVWRAFGGVSEIEADGMRHVLSLDRTAVLLDVREAAEFRQGSLPDARNVPRGSVLDGRDVGELRKAKDDGRLPMNDHNTRIIVVGRTAADARYVAQQIAHEAFDNVAYFTGTFAEAKAALERR
ncbi:MAG: protein kinase [Frankiaceae bacterium]|nr:protein kinase [Arenimonas sp.]